MTANPPLPSRRSLEVARSCPPPAVRTGGEIQNMSGAASGNPGGSLTNRFTEFGSDPLREVGVEFLPNVNVALPSPTLTVDGTLMNESPVVAAHAQFDWATTVMMPVPPRAGMDWVAGDTDVTQGRRSARRIERGVAGTDREGARRRWRLRCCWRR